MPVWKTLVSSQNGSSPQVECFFWKPPPCRICPLSLSLIFIYHLYLLHNWAHGLTIVRSSKLSFLQKPLAVQSWPLFQSWRMPHKEACNLPWHGLKTDIYINMLSTATPTQSGNNKQFNINIIKITPGLSLSLCLASTMLMAPRDGWPAWSGLLKA